MNVCAGLNFTISVLTLLSLVPNPKNPSCAVVYVHIVPNTRSSMVTSYELGGTQLLQQIILLQKASSRNAVRKNMWQYLQLLLFPV